MIEDLLGACRFPGGGAPLVVAVSGGADSLALLVLAASTGAPVTAIHVDHRIRPGGADEAAAVAAAAEEWGAAFERRVVEVAPGPDLEARARRARYEALPSGVCTGHTADDLAETVLLNLCWGAGIDGLAPMRLRTSAADGDRTGAGPTGGDGTGDAATAVRRPILALRRTETAALCDAVGLVPLRDPSNDDPRFRRNRVRHELLPLLGDISARDPVPVLARQAYLLAEDAAVLDELAAAIDPTDARALAAAPPALARRALRRWLRAGEPEGHPPSAAELQRVLDVACGRAVACELGGGRRVARSQGRLRLCDTTPGSR